MAAVLFGVFSFAPGDSPDPAVVSISRAPAYQDAALLSHGWALPVAARYQAAGFEYQDNPSFCGPTSAANVVRSLGRQTDQRSVLKGTSFRTFLGYAWSPGNGPGMTLDQLADVLAVSTGREVKVMRSLDLAELREQLKLANDERFRFVANFNRAPLWGKGHGHISPILGYLEAEDLVFVGDVNKNYAPFLVSPDRLREAMDSPDSSTGKPRGLVRVGPVGDGPKGG
ncbi:MAG: phytochelatin synthase family protein [Parvularculaceae bacterium]|nr:phytochelatin synthase family protein [Parvularculaceae bacterium]